MANVHFIWCGPSRGAESTATPNAVSAVSPGDNKVVFWCQQQHAEGFRAELDPRIEIRSCDTVGDIAPEIAHGSDARWAPDTDEVLRDLQKERAFSAIKDLVSLIVLKAHGGYYFDTSTQIADESLSTKYSADSLAHALANAPDAPRVAMLEREGQSHHPGIQTRTAIVFGRDDDISDWLEPIDVPLVDVWAMYSPPGHPAMDAMWKSYVSRYNRLNPPEPEAPSSPLQAEIVSEVASVSALPDADTSVIVTACSVAPSFDAMSFHDIMADNDPREGLRNTLIGNLVIRSVYDGLLTRWPDRDDDVLANFTWPVTKLARDDQGTGASLIVPALGITKTYNNSWRKAPDA